MRTRTVSKERLLAALHDLKQSHRVYVPVREEGLVCFKPLEDDATPTFEFQNTRLSPKFLIQPESERMFEYTLDPEAEEAGILKEPKRELPAQLVVGIRPCDAKAVQLAKVNFDTAKYRDPYWLERYERTTFIGLGCTAPCSTCFCTSVECGPFHEEGLDAIMTDLGDRYLIRALTEKGEKILEGMEGSNPSTEEEEQAARIRQEAEARIVSRVPTDKLAEQDLMGLFEADFWEDLAFACINCGTCTFLCPTCWCFDIQDEVHALRGVRLRNWDSCMFPLFTLHGSGHNPRPTKTHRVRQRFMHKLKYYVDKYGGGVACVGCGRCVQHCPVNIDIRRVFEKMNEYVQGACER